VAADGTLAGPNLSLYRGLVALPVAVLASGGVRHAADVRALYEGALALEDALRVAEEGRSGS
jgi:phosphoribosylformimino-5-aminoimidazole carboxamide ribonucleotide (ProFAR) isomerase